MIQSPGAFFLCSFVDFVWNHKKKTFKTCNVYKCCLMVWIVVKYIYTKLEIFLLPERKADLLFYIFDFC